jgi:hypothetical protein
MGNARVAIIAWPHSVIRTYAEVIAGRMMSFTPDNSIELGCGMIVSIPIKAMDSHNDASFTRSIEQGLSLQASLHLSSCTAARSQTKVKTLSG